MIRRSQVQSLVPAAVIASAFIFASCTSNWPQFRGPGNNMVAESKNLPLEWSTDTNVAWTFDLTGSGWSSPVVWGNKVFITTSYAEKDSGETVQEPPPPPPPANRDTSGNNRDAPQPPPGPPPVDTSYLMDTYIWEVSCIDLRTGEELWTRVAHRGKPRTRKHALTNYASETPVTDGQRLYVFFGMTGLFCYDMDGTLLWQKDLGAYETLNGWGTGSSPALYKELLYIQVDNEENSFIVALDKITGKEVWRAGREEKTNYSTPMIWENIIRTELVVGGKTARSYDPMTGKVFWELNVDGAFNIPSPVADREHLYLGNAGNNEFKATLIAVKAGAAGDITPAQGKSTSSGVLWSDTAAATGNPSPLLYNGLLYVLGSRGEMTCYDPVTGTIIYQEKAGRVAACWASPWAHNDRICFIDEKGVTHIIKAGREFEVLRANTLDDKFWASVAVTRNAYLFKGVERLYCIK
jgi:outer membrane protein assembly factor BamB